MPGYSCPSYRYNNHKQKSVQRQPHIAPAGLAKPRKIGSHVHSHTHTHSTAPLPTHTTKPALSLNRFRAPSHLKQSRPHPTNSNNSTRTHTTPHTTTSAYAHSCTHVAELSHKPVSNHLTATSCIPTLRTKSRPGKTARNSYTERRRRRG